MTFKVIEVSVSFDPKTQRKTETTKTVAMRLTQGRAQAKADRLNDKETLQSPDGVIKGYMAIPE